MPPDQKFKEIRDRFFSAARPSDAPSSSSHPQPPPQPAPSSHAAEKRDQASASASPRSHMDSVHAASHQGSYGAMSNEDVSEEGPEGSKSKRELSTSKRAAQNRAAQVCPICSPHMRWTSQRLTARQRAFRQRKERYITELEEKVKRYQSMETDFQSLQDENHQLREYILNLQSQLLGQNKEPSASTQPLSPQRKRAREDAEQHAERDVQSESAPGPGGAPPPPQGMTSGDSRGVAGSHRAAPASGESWGEHIDNLRQRYGDYPAHRPSAEGEPSSAAGTK